MKNFDLKKRGRKLGRSGTWEPGRGGADGGKLHAATAAQRAAPAPVVEEGEEPVTSFKTAFVVVILLHVVMIGGVVMFSSMKSRGTGEAVEPAAAPAASPAAPVVAQPAATPEAAVTNDLRQPDAPVVRPTATPIPAPVVKPSATPAPVASGVKDSGKVHTVMKGETLTSIARKFKVDQGDLAKLNNVSDPRKLRIGQKLKVPVKR